MRDVVDGEQHVSVDALTPAPLSRNAPMSASSTGAAGTSLYCVARRVSSSMLPGRGDFAAAKDGHVIARQLDLGQQMRVEQDGRAVRGRFGAQDVADLAAADGIDAVGRLVEQQHVRRMQQRDGDAEALRHPLRILLDADVDPLRDAQLFQQLQRTALDRGVVHAGHLPEDRQRLPRGEVAGDFVPLGQVTDAAAALGIAGRQSAEARFAGGGAGEVEQDLDGRRFAGAVRAEKAEQLAFADAEVDAVQRGDPRASDRRPVLLFEA